MKVTPIEIRKYEFKRTMRGYDPDEVRYFLEMLADELEALNREKLELESKVKQYDTKLDEYRQIEKSMQNALIVAKETSDKSLANSRKESKLIIADAEAHADRIIENARKEASRIQQEITRLRIQRDTFLVKIKNLLHSELEILDALDGSDEDLDEMDFEDTDEKQFNVNRMKSELRELDKDLFGESEEESSEDEEAIDFPFNTDSTPDA